MHLLRRIGTAIGLLAFAVAGTATAHTVSAQSDVVGHVYVNDNTSGTNTVAAFNRHSDGSLTPLHGSPFAAGGAGTGHALGSQGSLQVTSDGRYLLAADAGSNQISVLRIGPDGELRAVGGGPVSSGGVEPDSIAIHGNLVYVANTGAGGSNYTGFTLNGGGQLRPLSNSTFPLADTAAPGDVLFNSTGTNLVGMRVGTSVIDSFAVGSDGRLTPAAGSPFTAQGSGPFGSEFRPTDPTQLFVSNAHGGPGAGSISAFGVGADGTLTSIGSSPFPDNQTAPCWVEITHDGQYLFTVNTGSSTISRYAIGSDGSLTLLGPTSTPISGGGSNVRAFDARLDPSDSNLYVVDNGLDAVSAFTVSGGNLTELPSSPFALPAGATPFGIVVT